jgi:Uncharacterised nucleotidyltransferase
VEWPLLLECASAAPDPIHITELLRKADPAVLLPLAEEHGVTGLLANAVREVPVKTLPLPDLRRNLKERRRAQLFFALAMTAELGQLLDRFAATGIECLVVKGPVLSQLAYGDPGIRQYADLDLLVRHCNIHWATQVLMEAGYEPDVPLSAIAAGKIPGEYLFCRPNSRLLVELHTEHTFRYFPKALPLEDFFARQSRVRLDSQEVPALSLEDEFVLICIHGAKHFWERLMWIADVAALVARHPGLDWARTRATARQVGAERMLHVGLRLAQELLRTSLPPEIARRVQADESAARLAGQIKRWLPLAGFASPGLIERALFRVSMRGGIIAGPAYLMRLSLSPTEEDWVEGAEEKRHWLLDALRRPFRLARKYARPEK